MKQRTTIARVAVALAVILGLFAHTRFEARGQFDRWAGRTITGTVYYIGGFRPAQSRAFTLRINRLTAAAEVQQLNQALQSGGQDDLLSTLTHMEAGRISIGTGVGIRANAIIATQEGNRTKLIVLYERDVRFAELRYGARSENYRFGYAELFLGGGQNEGMLIPAAQVSLKDGNTWVVEDFGTFPARLMGLQVRGARGAR
jgi:hypothetical protein